MTVEADVDSVGHDGVPLAAAELIEVVPAGREAMKASLAATIRRNFGHRGDRLEATRS